MQIEDINFLIIGATKSATTWLQQSLQQDATVCMPDPELHYFSRNYDKGDEWYLSQFDSTGDHRLIGEKSNSYMDTPGVAARIRQAIPGVLLIAQLRNPVDRAYSDYCMLFRRGEVGRDVAQYLDPRRAAGGRFLNGGLYHQQLQPYLDLFPAQQLQVLLYENIRSDPQRQLDAVRSFLKLQSELRIPPVTKKVKDKTDPIVSPGLRQILKPLKPVLAPFRNNFVMQGLRSVIAHETKYSPLEPDLCARMIEFYAPEAERLGKLIKQDLSGWLSQVSAMKAQLRPAS
ncbi:sulfotransferase domain-containing protein [Pararhizobium sp. YC-54]|uniref:sulfotransferase family protein n=1 Tax=Pararhizobium sp. YC-54 TaxID=2986920 RepID=UPI0021F74227|nr:sulfotransferase [Pararhizobium sp. YC-54]MCV9999543.1 sulfotransferase domain-containing protein [Pararhizobium sp. YC-54]